MEGLITEKFNFMVFVCFAVRSELIANVLRKPGAWNFLPVHEQPWSKYSFYIIYKENHNNFVKCSILTSSQKTIKSRNKDRLLSNILSRVQNKYIENDLKKCARKV